MIPSVLSQHVKRGVEDFLGDPMYLTLDPEIRQHKEDQQMDYLFRAIMENVRRMSDSLIRDFRNH